MINNDKGLFDIILCKRKDGTFGKLSGKALKLYFANKEIYDYINNRYNDLAGTNDMDIFYEVVYRLRNNIEVIPKCASCGKPVRLHHTGNCYYYSNDCSRECRYKILKAKRDKTIKEKYGVDNPYQLDWVKADIRKKVNERYGGFTMERSSSIYNKFKKTMI